MLRRVRWVVRTASRWPARPGRWGRGHGVGVGDWCRTRAVRWCLVPCLAAWCARGTGIRRVGMARCTLAPGMGAWRGPCLPPPACSSRWPPLLRCSGGGHPVRSPWGSRRTGRVGGVDVSPGCYVCAPRLRFVRMSGAVSGIALPDGPGRDPGRVCARACRSYSTRPPVSHPRVGVGVQAVDS